MHYGNWAFSINNKMTIEANQDRNRMLGQRDGFSRTDVRQLNKVYKCTGYENVKVPSPKGKLNLLFTVETYFNLNNSFQPGGKIY